jgi:hypothetical protein
VKPYVELPITSDSARVHATSNTMAAAPETAIAAGMSHARIGPCDLSAAGVS